MELAPRIRYPPPKSLNFRVWLPPLSELVLGSSYGARPAFLPFPLPPLCLSTGTPYPQPFSPEAPGPANLPCQYCLFLLDLVSGWMAGALPLLSLSSHPHSPTLCINRLRATGRTVGQIALPQRASVRDTAGDVARGSEDPKEKLLVTRVGRRIQSYGTPGSRGR